MEKPTTAAPNSTDDLPPETHNAEQDPVGTQAQDVAEDARREDSRTSSPLESTKPESYDYDPAPDSTGDLIDEMRRMEGSGMIDMSAFAGEPNHDDETGAYGGETTDDADDDWTTADGESLAEEVSLLAEAEARDDDDIIRSEQVYDEED